MVNYQKPIAVSGTLCATFQISTVPINPPNPLSFDYPCGPGTDNICGYGPSIEFYMQAKNWSSGDPTKRWWALSKYTLQDTNGQVSICTPLTPDKWGDADGHVGNYDQTTTDGFNSMIGGLLVGWGWSEGGGYFDGHGSSGSQGTARSSYTASEQGELAGSLYSIGVLRRSDTTNIGCKEGGGGPVSQNRPS